jgi:hypothetical protein
MNSLSKTIQQRKNQEAKRELVTKIWVLAQKDMYLRMLHFLRFFPKTRFKKRLLEIIDEFGKVSWKIKELDKDHVKVSLLLKELDESGIDLTDFFDDLLELEEAQYDIAKMNEYGRRCAKK